MAKLKIKKYVNNNEKMPKAYGKTYGRIEHVDTLDTLDLAKHIQRHGSIFARLPEPVTLKENDYALQQKRQRTRNGCAAFIIPACIFGCYCLSSLE